MADAGAQDRKEAPENPATAKTPIAPPSKRPLLTRRRALIVGGLAAGALIAAASGGGDALLRLLGGSARPYTGSTFAFDTFCTFTVYGDDAALAKLTEACARYDALFDLYDETSDIGRINAAQGAPTEVDPATASVIARALELSPQLDGLFDISIGAVSTLWDFKKGVRPSDEAIAQALPHVGWQGVHVDEQAGTVTLDDPAAKLDLGGIAKGFVADRLIELLRDETNATAAVISLGGNIVYFGEKPGGEPWATGIRDPNDPGGDKTIGTTHTTGGTVVTSGLYERTFTEGDTTYWHILDPRTGMPAATDVVADTVFGASSTTADALSTALFAAGSSRGIELVDGLANMGAYFVLDSGTAAESARWQELTDFTA